MPDLDTVTYRYCRSMDGWKKEVPSSDGKKTYIVGFGNLWGAELERQGCTHGWTCTCPQFVYRHKECKHIKEAMNDPEWCGWHEAMEPPPHRQPLEETDPAYDEDGCPYCGGETHVEAWGV